MVVPTSGEYLGEVLAEASYDGEPKSTTRLAGTPKTVFNALQLVSGSRASSLGAVAFADLANDNSEGKPQNRDRSSEVGEMLPITDIGPSGAKLNQESVSVAQLTDIYRNMLGRNPDKTGLDYWAEVLASGAGIDDVVSNIKGSAEYVDRQEKDSRPKNLGNQDYLIVQRLEGDTLIGLSTAAYNDPGKSYLIQWANGISSDDELAKLDAVIIPDEISQYDNGQALIYTNTRTGRTWSELYLPIASTLDSLVIEENPNNLPSMIGSDAEPMWRTAVWTAADGTTVKYTYRVGDTSIPDWITRGNDLLIVPGAGVDPTSGSTNVGAASGSDDIPSGTQSDGNGAVLGGQQPMVVQTDGMQQVVIRGAGPLKGSDAFFTLSSAQLSFLGAGPAQPVTPPVITTTAPVLSTGLGEEVDKLILLSASLTNAVIELKKRTWKIGFSAAGSGSAADRTRGVITIDGQYTDSPLEVVQLLAHEVGHALYDYHADYSSKENYVSGALTDEGYATINNIRVEREILSSGGPDIGIAGRLENRDAYISAYDKGLTTGNLAAAAKAIGEIYGSKEFTSTSQGKLTYYEYYGGWYDSRPERKM